MKKSILLVAFMLASIGMIAQTTLKAQSLYDVNQDDQVSISDVSTVAKKVVENAATDKTVVDTETLLEVLNALNEKIAAQNAKIDALSTSLAQVKAKLGIVDVIAASSITLSQSFATVITGSTLTLTATVLPESASDNTVTWSSDNETVATVSDAGVVTAVAAGTANITATANDGSGVSAACAVTVSDDPSDQHEYVDLGLSVKWAKCNIGATNIYDYGDYFAWGETSGYNSGKTTFTLDTYKYYSSTSETTKDGDGFDVTVYHKGYTKYVTSSDASSDGYDETFYDDKTTLESSDDAATANWGSKWRMPTEDEWLELCDDCTWEWATLNGVNGYKVTATNGNYIFLPAAGHRVSSKTTSAGSDGYYWSSSLSDNGSENACSLSFSCYNNYVDGNRRNLGQSVRAVRSE